MAQNFTIVRPHEYYSRLLVNFNHSLTFIPLEDAVREESQKIQNDINLENFITLESKYVQSYQFVTQDK